MDLAFAWATLGCAGVPALLFLWNVFLYRAPRPTRTAVKGVSVLIPARNEEHTIGAAVNSALANTGVLLEVIVLDDESTDKTAEVLNSIASIDPRLRVVRGSKIPAGWCGKQHACAQLSTHAQHPLLCFMDADVVLKPDALARMTGFLEQSESHLISGVPRQLTGSFLERLLIPLIHFVLLGFLPIFGMRRSLHPSFAAGCGQLFLARAESYRFAGGHAAIRSTLHDGINLPNAFRRAGLNTDLFDATKLASCRMYRSGSEVWQGLKKNATEGLGAPQRIAPMSAVLLLGQVLPFFLVFATSGRTQVLLILAIAACYTVRLISALLFRQSLAGAILHPLGILLLLAIQWQALAGHLSGARVQWKGRAYAGPAGN